MTLLTPKADVEYIYADSTIRQGLEKLRAHGFTAVPVIFRDGSYCGVVSEGDFLWAIMDDNIVTVQELENRKVEDLIRKKVPACHISVSFEELAAFITSYNFVPMSDDRGIFLGIITRKSVINKLLEK